MNTRHCHVAARKYLEIFGPDKLLPLPTRDDYPLTVIGDEWYWGEPSSAAVCEPEDALNSFRIAAEDYLTQKGSLETSSPEQLKLTAKLDSVVMGTFWNGVLGSGRVSVVGETIHDALIKLIKICKETK